VAINVQQSAHILLHAKIFEEDLFVRQVEKTLSYTDKGGFNSDPPHIIC